MKKYFITGFKHGVRCTIEIRTIPECVERRAAKIGLSDILCIEEG